METSNFLIVGLGNPGDKYALTRHNVGFWVVDFLAEHWGAPKFSSKYKGHVTEVSREGKRVFLLKPQTYMNLSGESVQQLVAFYKINPEKELLVVTDDLDLPAAQTRLRLFGGTGGHNGLKSIVEKLGSEKFPRLRIGIGRSPTIAGEDWVLTGIEKSEWPIYQDAVALAAEGIEKILSEGLEKAMNFVNQRKTDGA